MAVILTQIPPDLIKMEIKMHLPQTDVISYLHRKGYEVKAFAYILEAEESMLLNEPKMEVYSFTATKGNEEQSKENHYLKVFETEIKQDLKVLNQ
ncbi:hypothetical protein [Elizabethkingia anophelis]|uniref:hypothetical protein n=1 Tax=Elizabethkingia anophelis TaxID=1117645 RepID=UPI0013163F48|nr:hypothetical protein [Elizabethkingia anophelis]BBQ07953.1 hypothetical protein JUNP353_2524 [Elizabethkingia anophelis]